MGGEDGLLEDNGGRGPGRPPYGQHQLHRLKPLLIQLPQQHHHPSSCVMNILLSLCPGPLWIKQENDLTKKRLFISQVSLGNDIDTDTDDTDTVYTDANYTDTNTVYTHANKKRE